MSEHETLIVRLVGDLSEKLGALQRDMSRALEQGDSIGNQHTFLLEQQGKILEDLTRYSRELVDLRETVRKIQSEPPVHMPPRDRAPSMTTEAREKQTESMRVAAEAMQSTARANKWTPWLVAAAVTAGTFFTTLANSCALLPHH